jgi:prolyl-tRNA synthetase
MEKPKTAIRPTRAENYAEWYQAVVKAAELAEAAPVRGCMVIKPWGYALWEQIQGPLDSMLKQAGYQNFYCPLFIPVSFLEREAAQVEGFAKECAVVTHHRLVADAQGKLVPDGPLEEPLIVRPTSETIINEMMAKWIQSYRDLPLLLNQWANVVRWELRPRMFLRTAEFLWHEAHTAHADAADAAAAVVVARQVYATFLQEYLAIPAVMGEKPESERFPGALHTYTFEAMMQDGKALQACTVHFLGQNFAKAFDIKFLDAAGQEALAWTTSWGLTTRTIGALIMTHGDDDGLCLPPKIAPLQVVILPLIHAEQDKEALLAYASMLQQRLQALGLRVTVDTSEGRAGDKAWRWVKRGVPLRVELGKRELEQGQVCYSQRHLAYGTRVVEPLEAFITALPGLLQQMQVYYYERALSFQKQHTQVVTSLEALYAAFQTGSGFVIAPWGGDADSEARLKQELQVTARCLPDSFAGQRGTCIFTAQPGAVYTLFARAY